MGKFSYSDKLHMQTLWQVSHCLVYAERLSQCGRLDCRLFLNSDQLPPFVRVTGK